jgi:putative iron-dependent peroxidase
MSSDNFQPAILTGVDGHGVFLTVHLHNDAVADPYYKYVAGIFPTLVDKIVTQYKLNNEEAKLQGTIGFGVRLTEKLFKQPTELSTSPYESVVGGAKYFPATGGDIFVHIKSARRDACFLLSQEFVSLLPKKHIKHIDEVDGWVFLNSQDLSGFEDGAANPKGSAKKLAAVVDERTDKNHLGGSYAIGQKWIHDLDQLNKMPLKTQEAMVGRTKSENMKIRDRPETSHVSRMTVEGEDMKIHRQSMPFGNILEHGLFFIGYSNSIYKFKRMLQRMDGSEDKRKDAIISYSKPVAGNFWYMPSLDELKQLLSENPSPSKL